MPGWVLRPAVSCSRLWGNRDAENRQFILSLSLKEAVYFKNINLTLADGEMLLLAGRSGCGKSTLIKAVSGLLGSEERGELQGAIYLQGEDISKWPPEKQASW